MRMRLSLAGSERPMALACSSSSSTRRGMLHPRLSRSRCSMRPPRLHFFILVTPVLGMSPQISPSHAKAHLVNSEPNRPVLLRQVVPGGPSALGHGNGDGTPPRRRRRGERHPDSSTAQAFPAPASTNKAGVTTMTIHRSSAAVSDEETARLAAQIAVDQPTLPNALRTSSARICKYADLLEAELKRFRPLEGYLADAVKHTERRSGQPVGDE